MYNLHKINIFWKKIHLICLRLRIDLLLPLLSFFFSLFPKSHISLILYLFFIFILNLFHVTIYYIYTYFSIFPFDYRKPSLFGNKPDKLDTIKVVFSRGQKKPFIVVYRRAKKGVENKRRLKGKKTRKRNPEAT